MKPPNSPVKEDDRSSNTFKETLLNWQNRSGVSSSNVGRSSLPPQEIVKIWSAIGEIRQICDELKVAKDRNESDQRRRMRDVYVELRNSYPSYLTLLTILFTITIPKEERWFFILFTVLCELLFLLMGWDAWERLKEIQKETGGDGAVERGVSFRWVQRFFGLSNAQNHDAERQPLVSNRSISANSEECNLLAVIAFACLYTFLLTMYLLAS